MFDFFRKKQALPLPYTTDMHCHIVPGIDDGSPDAMTSADLVERMQGWGVERILATPHVTLDTFENTPETIAPAFDALKKELESRGNNIKIAHSAEYRIDEFLLRQIEKGNLRPFPGNYLLVENAFVQEPFNLDQFLFDLRMKGYKPILAHPERYVYYSQRHRERYKQLHATGIYFQVNVLSFAGYYGKMEKQTAEYLLQNSMVDFLGTDLHNHHHADAIDSYLSSRDYVKHRKALTPRNDGIGIQMI